MMLGKIFEIKRFAVHDGPGIRTTIFFKGCPLNCRWCHNPEGISAAPEIALLERLCAGCGECAAVCSNGLHSLGGEGHFFNRKDCTFCLSCVNGCMPQALKLYGKEYTAEELYNIAVEDTDFYAQSVGGVTCSGGEPLMQADFIAGFLKICKDGGLHTAVDTSGYAGWPAFEKVIPYTDIFLYDIKHMDAAEHKRLTGKDNALILENIKKLSFLHIPVEVRMPIIPGLNDSEENIRQAARFLKNISSLTLVRVLPYHAYSGTKYSSIGRENNMPETTGEESAAVIRTENLLKHEGIITGGH